MRKRNLIIPLVFSSSLFIPSIEALESTTEFNSLENENNIAIDILIAEGSGCGGGGGGGGGMSPKARAEQEAKRQKSKDAAKKRIIKAKRAAGKSLTDEEKKIICTSGDDCNFEIDFFPDNVIYSMFLNKEKEVKKFLIENNMFSPSIWNIFQNYRYEILQEYINNTKHPGFINETLGALEKIFPVLDMEGFPKISAPYTYEKYMKNFQPLFDDERKFSSVLLRAFAENSEELTKDTNTSTEAMGFTLNAIQELLLSIMNTLFYKEKL